LVCRGGFNPLSVETDPDIDKPALPKCVIYKTKWYYRVIAEKQWHTPMTQTKYEQSPALSQAKNKGDKFSLNSL
jgi:hypothetical protein